MKRIATILALLLFAAPVFSQKKYGNEWIDYSKTYYKIKVAKDGFYRIDYNTLLNAGFPVSTVKANQYQLFHNGQQVPLYITATDTLTPADTLEFFGEKNDGKFDKGLYPDSNWHAQDFISIFTDSSAYFLTWDASASNPRMINVFNDIANAPAEETFIFYKARNVYPGSYREGAPSSVQASYEFWTSAYEPGEGMSKYRRWEFTTDLSGPMIADENISTPFPYSTGNATLKTAIIGLTSENGNTRTCDFTLSLNSQNLSNNVVITGNEIERLSYQFPISYLSAPVSTLTFYANTATPDFSLSWSYVEIEYPRQVNFDGQNTLRFTLPASASARYLKISNFSNNGNQYILYDLTNNQRVEGIADVDGFLKFVLPAPVNASLERDMYVTNQEISAINKIIPVQFTDYSATQNQGDYIIISHPVLFYDASTSSNPVEEYKNYRKSSEGGSYAAIVVNVEELYDQFAYGIGKHPLSIHRFIEYALDSFAAAPQHVFLLGKALHIASKFAGCLYTYESQCLVPTFGNPPSDLLLAAEIGKIIPRVSIGRLAAQKPEDVTVYLNKIKDFDNNIRNAANTPEERGWMKNILHLGGGINSFEQVLFRGYLQAYEKIVEDTSFGGNVYSFYKTSSEPIQSAASKFVDSLINSGLSVINFFGHSSSGTFDYSIDYPDKYVNYQKYPMIIANGCYTGQIHECFETTSERFVLIEDKGAIAYLAALNFGVPYALDLYNQSFFKYFSQTDFGESIGKCIEKGISDISASFFNDPIIRIICEQTTLHGDPAIRFQFNPDKKPDYYIDASRVRFNPPVISAKDDSFDVTVNVFNLGKAVGDSFNIIIQRTMPPGQLSPPPIVKRFPSTACQQSYPINIRRAVNDTLGDNGLGLNTLEITVDGDNEIDEYENFANNSVSISFWILSDDAIPIYPYEFSIVSADSVTLYASTANPLSDISRDYIIQIDTTENFDNSPGKKSVKISSKGGVLQWTPKFSGLSFKDSTVYYWRVSLDTSAGNPDYNWKYSSFIYINGSPKGWNQSHYFQFKKDDYANMKLDTDRVFKFIGTFKDIGVLNLVPHTLIDYQDVKLFEDGFNRRRSSCLVLGYWTGILFAFVDSVTGSLVSCTPSNEDDFGTGFLYCSGDAQYTWEFYLSSTDTTSLDNTPNYDSIIKYDILKFLDQKVPQGAYLLGYVFNWYKDIVRRSSYMDSLITYLDNEFKIDSIEQVFYLSNFDTFARPYVFFTQKGHPDKTIELVGDTFTSVIDASFSIPQVWNQGNFKPLAKIGPASNWRSLHWRTEASDSPGDSILLSVFGVNKNNTDTLLFQLSDTFDLNLFGLIDAQQYPYLKLQLDVEDDSLKTAPQLKYWRVLYDELPEASLNRNKYFSFYNDTIQQGENLVLSIAMENVSDLDMDSMVVKYIITRANGTKYPMQDTFAPLLKRDTLHLYTTIPVRTPDFRGKNQLFIDMNPDNIQPEQYHFNNIGLIDFWVTGDYYNPLLDVTFDGIHIMDGDIVSAKPNILVKLKDENKFVALDDTTNFLITLIQPNKQLYPLYFNNSVMKFIPADPQRLSSDNTAHVEIKPELLQDGKYELIVSATDKAGNQAGRLDYKTSFEVINKPMITNVLNYPNPFTTSTRFVFTLTGYRIPTFFKIQIMTITGKVVREVMLDELGALHIGRNITEFAWDGTDMYGDKLANGLYLYRVVASINGNKVEHFEKEKIDKYFKSGFGKMYLMR